MVVGRAYVRGMKLFRSAAVVALARKAYIEAQKPENQARIRSAVAKVQERRRGGGTTPPPRPRP